MMMPDVNVLIYAHRTDERVHAEYKRWLDGLIKGSQPFALSVLVAVAFVRIVTNKKIYAEPTPLPMAIAAMDQIAAQPNCRLVAPGPDHWHRVATLLRGIPAPPKLIADAQHAAVAMAEGCTWVTRDGDFAQFAPLGLSWRHLSPTDAD
jgi:toxin-antitoxin system PIN domain toxin